MIKMDYKERIQDFADKRTLKFCEEKKLTFDDLSRFRQQRILNGVLHDHPHANVYAVETGLEVQVKILMEDNAIEYDDLSVSKQSEVWRDAESDEASYNADRTDEAYDSMKDK